MFRPARLLAAATAALTLSAVAACGAQPADQAAPQPGDRVVEHAMGKTTIQDKPQRVIVLDTGELDAALALGVRPVGVVQPDAGGSLPPYLAQQAGKPEIVGTIGSPNLERIAALKPDLILSSKVRDGERYDQLSAIAPTVFAETTGKTWQQNFLLDAEALGKPAEAQRILGEYRQRAAAIGAQAGDPGRTRVSMLRFVPGDIRLYGKGSFIGSILADAGFARPQNQQADTTFTRVSREQVGQADGDLLFYAAYGDNARGQMNDVIGSAQWPALGAVRAGNAVEVPDGTWFLGLGPIAANLVLDDLQRQVARR